MATRLDPLEYLERSDKWYLGGGRGGLFAPAFPRFLESFGFWDESYYVDVRLERLFTVVVMDERERPLQLRKDGRRWTPDALTHTHTTPDGLRIREDKVLTPQDTLASRLSIYNEGKKTRKLHFILWSLQDRDTFRPGVMATSGENATREGDYAVFDHTVNYGDTPYADRPAENGGWGERNRAIRTDEEIVTHSLSVALGSNQPLVSAAIHLAQRTDTAPNWTNSIVPEKFRDGKFAAEIKSKQKPPAGEGHIHICLHYTLEIPAGETRTIQFGASLHTDRNVALLHLQNDLQQDVAAVSRANWRVYFNSVPYFECSDPHLQKMYWYRWYSLRLSTVDIGGYQIPGEEGIRFPYPCVFEGIGGFRSHISYSAQCHMLEAVWKHDPALAYGCIEGIFLAQEKGGYLPGHLYFWRHTRGFYHANWGANALQIFHVTGDLSFVERVYPDLSRYAEYFERDRDREDLHLYDVLDQGETGQEYASRYLFADNSADDWRQIHLKGVDATVYIYQLQRSLASMAVLIGNTEEAKVWNRKADDTRIAIRTYMWDPETKFFYDYNPKSGQRSPYKAAVGFYPFLCDIVDESHVSALHEHLFNPEEFSTEFPVPSASLDDPNFSPEGDWMGKRMSCPWNGRVWPMTNSHISQALATAAINLDHSLKPMAADMITRFIKMMFFDGDPERPNTFEHYNPLTGSPCTYRGIDDYQHSWVIDLLIKYLVGLQPGPDNSITLDPLPFAISYFRLEDVKYHGKSFGFVWDSTNGYKVHMNGDEIAALPGRERTTIPIP